MGDIDDLRKALTAGLIKEIGDAFAADIAPYDNAKRVEIVAKSEDEADLDEARVQIWLALADITAAMDDAAWDVLLLDVRDGSEARISARPAKLQLPFVIPQHPDHDTPEHVMPWPDAFVDATIGGGDPLAQVDTDPDDPRWSAVIEPLLEADIERRTQQVMRALEDPRLAEARRRWDARPQFAVLRGLTQGIPFESTFQTLRGAPLPKPPQPTTTFGVIARWNQQMDIHVARSTSGVVLNDADEVVEASLSGAMANDQTVALLDDVQDVAKVCASLKKLTLDHTRISKQGVKKLKTLLPHVTIEQIPKPGLRGRLLD